MIEVNAATPLVGEHGKVTLLDVFEGGKQLIAYYFMWYSGKPAPEQCEGCTWVTSQVRELSYVHSRDLTFAVFCQGIRRKREVPQLHGMGNALVLGAGLAQNAACLTQTTWPYAHSVLSATRIQGLRDLLDHY